MIHESVHRSITEYRANAYLSGLPVDAGEVTNQEINSYIVFILVALEKRNKEVAPGVPISRKVKKSDEYLKIESQCLWQDKRTYNCSPKVHNSASSLG